MTPFLNSLLDEGLLPRDSHTTQLLNKMQEANKAKLDSFQAKLEDAKENLGETEVAEAVKARATYLAQIGHNVGLPPHTYYACVYVVPTNMFPTDGSHESVQRDD